MINHQICNRCVMDSTADDITFNEKGICNFCSELLKTQKNNEQHNDSDQINQRFTQLLDTIKRNGKGKKYDCIVGVSGGVDSCFTLHLAVSHGLRPLAVHMDNGWNSELAQHNIENLVKKLQVTLHTHVIDWQEYKNLMQAFFDSDVIDIELLYDNAMLAVNYKMAVKYGIRYVLSGCNHATEGIKIPNAWNNFKLDKKNIKNLANRANVKIKTFPSIGVIEYIYLSVIKNIKWIFTLDYIEYNKEKCLKLLKEEYDFKPYPYKHYESIFTRFYQAYILPKKFGVDKRKVHFSSLIMSNQMTRSEALQEIKETIPYPHENNLEEDIQYFLKKMQWKKLDLDNYLKRPGIPHSVYGSELSRMQILKKVCGFLQ